MWYECHSFLKVLLRGTVIRPCSRWGAGYMPDIAVYLYKRTCKQIICLFTVYMYMRAYLCVRVCFEYHWRQCVTEIKSYTLLICLSFPETLKCRNIVNDNFWLHTFTWHVSAYTKPQMVWCYKARNVQVT